MTKALHVFTVTRRGVCVRVRVLPSVKDVLNREYRSQWRAASRGETVKGYFELPRKARYIGTITLAASGSDLTDHLPHEVVHAAMQKLICVTVQNDEPLAYLVGNLCSSIRARLKQKGIES